MIDMRVSTDVVVGMVVLVVNMRGFGCFGGRHEGFGYCGGRNGDAGG